MSAKILNNEMVGDQTAVLHSGNTGALARYNPLQCVSILMGKKCHMLKKAKNVQYLFDGLGLRARVQLVPMKIEISCNEHLVRYDMVRVVRKSGNSSMNIAVVSPYFFVGGGL